MRKSSISLIVMGLVFGVAAALFGGDLVVSAQNSNSSTTMSGSQATPKRTGRCDPMQQEQTDLSGTYTGKVNYPDANLSGDATLTITGNDFTLTAGSTTQTGRVTAVTTCNYTGVTMMFGDTTPPDPKTAPPPLPAVSLRAKKTGKSVTLTSVPGETRSFSFGSEPAGRHRTHKPRKAATPPPPPPE